MGSLSIKHAAWWWNGWFKLRRACTHTTALGGVIVLRQTHLQRGILAPRTHGNIKTYKNHKNHQSVLVCSGLFWSLYGLLPSWWRWSQRDLKFAQQRFQVPNQRKRALLAICPMGIHPEGIKSAKIWSHLPIKWLRRLRNKKRSKGIEKPPDRYIEIDIQAQ